MYRNVSSPIFDVPEFPTLRRVKPLPKRRKTSSESNTTVNGDSRPTTNGSLRTPATESANGGSNGNSVPHIPGLPFSLPNPLPGLPGPDATAEELLAHADALQSYYLPILDAAAANMASMAGMTGVAGLADVARMAGITGNNFGKGIGKDSHGLGLDEEELSLAAASFGLSLREDRLGGGGRGDEESDDHGDGDYIDHLQQPGNTKKRKVPANTFSSSSRFSGEGGDELSDFSGEHDGLAQQTIGIPTGSTLDSDTGQNDGGGGTKNLTSTSSTSSLTATTKPPSTLSASSPPSLSSSPSAPQLLQTRILNHRLHSRNTSRLSAVTLASLQQKETLKVRKRQLAAVLGALSATSPTGVNGSNSHSNSNPNGTGDENTLALALDQALSGAWTYPYPFPYPFSSSSSLGSSAGDASVSGALVPSTKSSSSSTSKPKIRLSKRAKPRMARKVKTSATSTSTTAATANGDLPRALLKTKSSGKKSTNTINNNSNKENEVPEGEFTFVFQSASECS
ncbi:hypothetical protein GYMLUDRAFT_969476 [Collybiopsis luxurians FD-317 M1]|uniref:Uncharacterized protein n=1 Tax=Collybiopsis luxurians FD-317 M1 TaxID=944289 RepID=A0A0D0CBL0_9AGAR|nr:hypothetical protein GYMLUDRAFT_969476 [Collybiopsis luxurians FD-317 M1]